MMPSQKKLALLVFLLIASVSVTIPAFAFQNEPDGFRGINWGTNLTEFSDTLLVESGKDSQYYMKKMTK